MTEKDAKKRLGLVLGGGGARGLAHIGVLKVLEKAGISVDLVAGTSMGAVLGAFYLAGVTAERMETEALRRSKLTEITKLIDIFPTPAPRLLKGQRISDLLNATLGVNFKFADLRGPLAVVVVDMNTGREVVIKEGNVVEALRGTISVPGVFAALGAGEMRMVDGGVLNNVPVDVAREMGAECVIAVDVLPDFSVNVPGEPPVVPQLKPSLAPRVYTDLWHVQLVMVSALTDFRLKLSPPDVLIRPELPADMDLFIGFHRPKVAIEAGERAAEAALPQILAALS